MERDSGDRTTSRPSGRPLRVLVTTSTFPVHLEDGNPRFVYDLAEALAAHADVKVLAPHSPGAARQERMGSLDVFRFAYFPLRNMQRLALGRGMRDNLRASWLARLQVPLYLIHQALATRALARRLCIDVVNAHWLVPQGLTAAWARGRRPRFKLVLHVHAGDVYLLRTLPLGRSIARFVVRRAGRVLADGTHVRDVLDQLLGFPSSAVVQCMGVRRDLFGRHPSDQSSGERLPAVEVEFPGGFLLFVGRLTEKKGAIYLIRAMRRILARQPGLGLVLIGDGPEEASLREEVDRLALGAAVHFAGRKPHAEIVRYLHACRAAVVPSIIDRHGETEGMPTVVVEALASGCRVVASAVDGIPDVLRHEKNGWLCRQKNPDDLAEKILAALDEPAPSPIVAAALETAGLYDWSRVAINYMRCLRDPVVPRMTND